MGMAIAAKVEVKVVAQVQKAVFLLPGMIRCKVSVNMGKSSNFETCVLEY